MIYDTNPRPTIVVIGLGYVGLTFAVHLARRGFLVAGVEKNPDIRDLLNRGQSPFFESGFAPHLNWALDTGRIVVSSQIPASKQNRVFVVTVGTPVRQTVQGREVDTSSVIEAASSVAHVGIEGDLVILRSTVSIGTTRLVARLLSEKSPVRLGLAFAPERTLEGNALNELSNLPQIFGGIDDASSFETESFFHSTGVQTIRLQDPESAEIAKLVNNVERDVQFAFANEIAQICDDHGVSFSQVRSACTQDYPRSSLRLPGPVAGPCLSKDGYILDLTSVHTRAGFATHARRVNDSLAERFLSRGEMALGQLTSHDEVVLSGVAFKGTPPTSDFRDSYATQVVSYLKSITAATIRLHDFEAPENSQFMGMPVASDLVLSTPTVKAVIFQNNHPNYRSLDLGQLSGDRESPLLVFDFWNQFSDFIGHANLRFLVLGEAGTWR